MLDLWLKHVKQEFYRSTQLRAVVASRAGSKFQVLDLNNEESFKQSFDFAAQHDLEIPINCDCFYAKQE